MSPEEDAFFDSIFPLNPYAAADALEPGQMIIYEQTLQYLEEMIEHLAHRARFYDEFSFSKAEFLEIMRGLESRCSNIRKQSVP